MGELKWLAPDEGDKVTFIWWLRHKVGVRTPRCAWLVPNLAGQPWGKLLNLWVSLPTQLTHNLHLILKGKERHLKRTASLYLGPYWLYTGLEHLISQGFASQGLGLAILLASGPFQVVWPQDKSPRDQLCLWEGGYCLSLCSVDLTFLEHKVLGTILGVRDTIMHQETWDLLWKVGRNQG